MLAKLVAGIDYLVPCLDIGVVFFWVPGVILFLFGYPLIFGWWSMLLLPITLVIFGFLERWQARHVFRTLGIHPEHDKRGFLALPVRLPGADLRSCTTRLCPIPRRGGSPLEIGARDDVFVVSVGVQQTAGFAGAPCRQRPGLRCQPS